MAGLFQGAMPSAGGLTPDMIEQLLRLRTGQSGIGAPTAIYRTPGIGDGLGQGNVLADMPAVPNPTQALAAGGGGNFRPAGPAGSIPPSDPAGSGATDPSLLPSGAPKIGFMGRLGSMQPGLTPDQLGTGGLRPAVLNDQPMMTTRPMDTSQLIQNVQAKGPGFFAKDGAWRQTLSDALLGIGASFGNPMAVATIRDRFAQKSEDREDKRLTKRKLLDWQLEQQKPQYVNNGKSWVRYDPVTGKAEQLFRSPSEEQQFAADLGLSPGTAEYYGAIKDRALGAQGPTNMAFRLKELKDQSARGWAGLNEAKRHHGVTESQGWTNASEVTPSKVIGPILNKIARGQSLSQGEQTALDRYKAMDPLNQYIGAMMGGGAMPSAPAPSPAPAAPKPTGPRRGQTATNPRTGQTITFDGKTWLDQNGRPVR